MKTSHWNGKSVQSPKLMLLLLSLFVCDFSIRRTMFNVNPCVHPAHSASVTRLARGIVLQQMKQHRPIVNQNILFRCVTDFNDMVYNANHHVN
jgi:hypothetical protein